MISIVDYSPDMARAWDEVVAKSAAGTFLHRRGYMDYHADRFRDASLVALNAKGTPVAVLPANGDGDTLWSHRGLTYGGWLTDRRKLATNAMLDIWDAAADHMRRLGYRRLVYKAVPYIYHRSPADDDIYGLMRLGARVDDMLISEAINLASPVPFDESAKQGAKKAEAQGVTTGVATDLGEFWTLLESVLAERHAAKPVHSLAEMENLRERFPQNIILRGAWKDDVMIAGSLLYVTDTVAHTQYIAASEEGRSLKALNLLFREYVGECTADGLRYLDFGTSNEGSGAQLNSGLAMQKCGMGGRGVAYTHYVLDLV